MRAAVRVFALLLIAVGNALPAEAPHALQPIGGVERQPLVSQAERLIEAMQFIGSPLARKDAARLEAAMMLDDPNAAAEEIQNVLNPYCLLDVHINPESRVKVARGPARAELLEQGWRAFLVRVHNEAGVTARLRVESKHAQPIYDGKANLLSEADVSDRWMNATMFDDPPMNADLSGLKVEYRIIQIYSRDAGKREGHLAFNVGQGTQDIGFRNDAYVLFDCRPSVEVTLRVRDVDGKPTTGSFIIKDAAGHVYPHSSKRLAPDFFFHDQVYRADGESVLLPAGKYEVTYGRGPEYIAKTTTVEIPSKKKAKLEFELERWIDPNARGYFSGDHHIHASGCLHYKSPTIGVEPDDMMRHVLGEGLNVGAVLTWGPGWYHQKRNFTGLIHPLSTDKNILRYDIEVSGFPSDHTGHLCLLRLQEDDYPGTEEKQEWPTWGLPILKWAKAQGAVTGVAHSGWGLDVFPEAALPNYVIPPMDGIGAQEYIVDAAHGAMDFISTVDTPYVWELNIWYHVLNCGFETKISGETDFPCIYGDRVGLGRSYVKLDGQKVDFDEWIQGVKAGRSYVSDGFSHLMDFEVGGVAPGGQEESKLNIAAPGKVTVRANVAAMLEPHPMEIAPRGRSSQQLAESREARRPKVRIMDLPYNQIPYWHVERARVPGTRTVPVEVVVNGHAVAREEIEANGRIVPVEFEIDIDRSSWVALRVLASSHTNPVQVIVGGEPVRPSKRSAQWCLDSIDQVWKKKEPKIRESERDPARKAFDEARAVYNEVLAAAHDDRVGATE